MAMIERYELALITVFRRDLVLAFMRPHAELSRVARSISLRSTFTLPQDIFKSTEYPLLSPYLFCPCIYQCFACAFVLAAQRN